MSTRAIRALIEAADNDSAMDSRITAKHVTEAMTELEAIEKALGLIRNVVLDEAAASVLTATGGWTSDPLPDAKTVKEVLASGILRLKSKT